jgi:hypothetical protein
MFMMLFSLLEPVNPNERIGNHRKADEPRKDNVELAASGENSYVESTVAIRLPLVLAVSRFCMRCEYFMCSF